MNHDWQMELKKFQHLKEGGGGGIGLPPSTTASLVGSLFSESSSKY